MTDGLHYTVAEPNSDSGCWNDCAGEWIGSFGCQSGGNPSVRSPASAARDSCISLALSVVVRTFPFLEHRFTRRENTALHVSTACGHGMVDLGVFWYTRSAKSPAYSILDGAWLSSIGLISVLLSQDYVSARYTLPNFNPNDIGLLMAMAIPVAFYLGWSSRHKLMRSWALTYVPVGFLAIALTASRTAFLISLLGLAFATWIIWRPSIKAKISVFVIAAVLAYIFYALIPDSSLNRLATSVEELQQGDIGGRMAIWKASVSGVVDTPHIGIGIGGFKAFALQAVGSTRSAHNSFIELAVELGIIGLGLFAAVLILGFGSALSLHGLERWFWLAILAAWLAAATVNSLAAAKFTWFFLALVVSVQATSAAEMRTLRHGRA